MVSSVYSIACAVRERSRDKRQADLTSQYRLEDMAGGFFDLVSLVNRPRRIGPKSIDLLSEADYRMR